jgi:two-component system secretion response regulator SsrB
MIKNKYLIPLSPAREACRILVADQNELVVFAFRKLLTHHPHLKLVGYSDSGLKAIEVFRKTQPTLIIVDPYLTDVSGLDLVKRIKHYNSAVKVIVYLSDRDKDHVNQFLKLNIEGIIDKNTSIKNILNVIHMVNNGQTLVKHNPDIEQQQNGIITLPTLSPREKQILKLIAEGNKSKEVANLLSLSTKTIECHRFNLMKKLGAHNVAQVIHWARQYNMI